MTPDALAAVDFVRPDGDLIPGLVPVSKKARNGFRLSIHETAALADAQSFGDGHIDFVFFRRFSDERSSQVAAYIVDNTDERLSEENLAHLHLQVWRFGKVPLLYVSWPARIDVLTCARGPDFWSRGECKYKPEKRLGLDTVMVASAIEDQLRRFSAFRLADGTFWDDPLNKRLSNHSKAAHQRLIQAVVDADRDLDGAKNPVMRRLLLLFVLIKYLEDRSVFPSGRWFGKWHAGARDFLGVLQGGDPDAVYRLLQFLERKFNGDVFRLPGNDRSMLTRQKLSRFAELIESKTLGAQRYLWEQFSFEHLPVEVVSHLYQRFVQGGHGAVYTPPFLATLLLDQAMPYGQLSGMERVLDPACGSGIFLVGAFERLINVWRSKNKWRKPNVNVLKGILRRSIHGIELENFAVDLTAFSLSLALCDALQPEVIWSDLKFERLRGRNLVEGDFFGVLRQSWQGEPTILEGVFDIVVGNPPFESRLSEDGKEVDKVAQQQDPDRGEVPDKQAAYLFLEQAGKVSAKGGIVCLVQPSGFLYGRNVHAFRRSFFSSRRVESVLDFTSVRKLYEAADPKTVALCARMGRPASGHVVKHWTFRRTLSVNERMCFELDHYDRHRVPQELAETDPYVWRVNLFGGGRLLGISKRLRRMRTLEEYIVTKQGDGWRYGEGFIVGNRRKSVSFLRRAAFLPNHALTTEGIDEAAIEHLDNTATRFEGPRSQEQFMPPLLLIRELASLPMASWRSGFLSYTNEIVGVHAPKEDEPSLRRLHDFLVAQRDVLRFSLMLHGTRALVARQTSIYKSDIDMLPCPEDPDALGLSFWEKCIQEDSLDYMADYVRLGQRSQLLQRPADINHLQQYSDTFVRLLGSVYDNLQAAEPVVGGSLICQPFYFGERPDLNWLSEEAEDGLARLVYDDEENYGVLRTTRVLRFCSENVLLIVKPERLRYWIRSTAIRDADETLVDLRQWGY